MKLALSLAVILGLALVSQAALISSTTVGTVTVSVNTDTVTPATGGLTAYIVTIASPVGIYSVDGRIDATSGHMNQVWAFGGALATPVADPLAPAGWSFLAATDQVNDSNIMVRTDNQVQDRMVAEDMAGTYLANSPTQTMAFGFKNLAQYTSIDFARVVLAAGANASFNFHISDNLMADDAFNVSIVPEPMTLSLLAAGALALIRRRR